MPSRSTFHAPQSLRFRAAFAAALALAFAFTLVLACGGGGGGGAGGGSTGGGSGNPPPANTIYVGDAGLYGTEENIFFPASLTVQVGTRVTWVWRGTGHAMQSGDGCAPDGRFTSNGVQAPGYQMSYTFTAAGTYPYYCSTHCGQLMKGTVTVQ